MRLSHRETSHARWAGVFNSSQKLERPSHIEMVQLGRPKILKIKNKERSIKKYKFNLDLKDINSNIKLINFNFFLKKNLNISIKIKFSKKK